MVGEFVIQMLIAIIINLLFYSNVSFYFLAC